MKNGVIVHQYPTMNKASDLNDALSKAKTFIYIYSRCTDTVSSGRFSVGLLIPVSALTSSGYYFNSTNSYGQILVFMKKNSYSNLSVTWTVSSPTDEVTEFYYM